MPRCDDHVVFVCGVCDMGEYATRGFMGARDSRCAQTSLRSSIIEFNAIRFSDPLGVTLDAVVAYMYTVMITTKQ